jgi:ligand-binding SRPBCC domain-containing protein
MDPATAAGSLRFLLATGESGTDHSTLVTVPDSHSAADRDEEGAVIEYALRVRGFPMRWLTEIERWDPPHGFVDVQRKGPYRLWRHTHRFFEADGGTRIVDDVAYALPFGPLGSLVHRFQVARDVSKIFDYRTERVRSLVG